MKMGRRPFLRPACQGLAGWTLLAAAMAHQAVYAQEGVSGAEAQHAMATLLEQRGLGPAGELNYDDYLVVEAKAASDGVIVRAYMDDDGALVPSGEWQRYNAEFCRSEGRQPQEQTQFLQFEINRTREVIPVEQMPHPPEDAGDNDTVTRDEVYLFASTGTVDKNGGVIHKEEQVEVDDTRTWTHKRGAALDGQANANETARTMSQAFDQLDNAPQSVAAPCGDLRVEHVAGREVGKPATFLAGFQGSVNPSLVYTWDYGDGSIASQGNQNGQHIYGKAGTYTVKVRVEGGRLGPASGQVTVTMKDEEEDEAGEAIQPRNGPWSVELVKHNVPYCHSLLKSRVESGIQQMLGGKSFKRTFEFSQPFHPAPVISGVTWEQKSANRWDTVMAQGGAGNSAVTALNILVVKSPEKMIGFHQFLSRGALPCNSIATFHLTFLGDK